LKAAESAGRDLRLARDRIEEMELESDRAKLETMSILDRLNSKIAAGTSGKVSDLESMVGEQKVLIKAHQQAAEVVSESFGRMWDALQDAYEAQGMKEVDAHERKMRVARYIPTKMGGVFPGFMAAHDIPATTGSKYAINHRGLPVTPDEILKMHRLQRARGLRS